MASFIPGYEYDIFISYRQKDNKYDGWVTEFVNNLKKELEATFKEDISVYFDINPHYGLLETHDVNESLKEKLKCLIFIPIISRTYCDPKSFAWEHEFKVFIEQASKDQFGLKVKLPNGNVASRILPVQIHNLHAEDKSVLEQELGGVLRPIEFIYKEQGINRPLTVDDDKETARNRTRYRNQINKIANAIDEIIDSLKGRQADHAVDKIISEQPYPRIENEETRESAKSILNWKKSKRWLIFIPSVIICIALVFALFKFIGSINHSSDIAKLEKSIAVLPFVNDSPDEENAYFINGIMEEILNNLQKIKEFRVLSRTSTEQFRGITRPTIPEIAKKLDVNYIVEGSGQKYGNKFVLRVQLIAAGNEKHLWGESYEKEINGTIDVINIQSQIAQTIATELKATITPEERKLIEKPTTTSLTAYDFYQKGRDEYMKFWNDNNKTALLKAHSLYNISIKYDSTFAQAYTGMAMVYWGMHYFDEYFSENFMDSVFILCNLALKYDDQLADAYTLKGYTLFQKGNREKASEEFEKALKVNPNSWMAYYGEASYYSNDDFVKCIDNLHKAASLNHGLELPGLLKELSIAYGQIGFKEKYKYYYLEALKLDADTLSKILFLANLESYGNNLNEKSLELCEKGYSLDSMNTEILHNLGYGYMLLGKYQKALKYYIKFLERLKALKSFQLNEMHRIGYVYFKNGYQKEADYYFNKQVDYCTRLINSNRAICYTYYDLAGAQAFRGDREKAYKNLNIFIQSPRFPKWIVTLIKCDPLFDSIRNEPEFQKIVKDVESKYLAEHERVKKWMEVRGDL